MTPQIIYALITALLMSIGQLFFKKASNFNLLHENLNFFVKFLTNPWFLIGLFMFGLSTITWIKALSGENLTKIYPLVSLAYIFTFIFAYFIFGEKITLNTILGTTAIIIGVIIIGLGK